MSFSSSTTGRSISSLTGFNPYSFSDQPFFKASERSATLCSLEPVKYWSANGNSEFFTARKSQCIPFFKRTEAFVSPQAITDSTSGRVVKSSQTKAPSLVATRKSISPTVSFARRYEPATATREISGCIRNISKIPSTTIPVFPNKNRSANFSFAVIPSRILLCVFSPNPASLATLPSKHAALSFSNEATPSSSYKTLIFFGPSPCTSNKSKIVGGNSSLSLS